LDWSIRLWPSMVSPANPTHFWREAPERCSTTTYAWWAAPVLTHVLAGLADDVGDELPQAAMTRASIALAHMRRLRTSIPPGGQPSRTRRGKPTARKLPYRCARTGRRYGRSGLLACGSPPRPAFPRLFTSVVFVGQGLPAHSCATAPVSHRIPLVPIGILARSGGSRRLRAFGEHLFHGLAVGPERALLAALPCLVHPRLAEIPVEPDLHGHGA
jgi:hypothetical protein